MRCVQNWTPGSQALPKPALPSQSIASSFSFSRQNPQCLPGLLFLSQPTPTHPIHQQPSLPSESVQNPPFPTQPLLPPASTWAPCSHPGLSQSVLNTELVFSVKTVKSHHAAPLLKNFHSLMSQSEREALPHQLLSPRHLTLTLLTSHCPSNTWGVFLLPRILVLRRLRDSYHHCLQASVASQWALPRGPSLQRQTPWWDDHPDPQSAREQVIQPLQLSPENKRANNSFTGLLWGINKVMHAYTFCEL